MLIGRHTKRAPMQAWRGTVLIGGMLTLLLLVACSSPSLSDTFGAAEVVDDGVRTPTSTVAETPPSDPTAAPTSAASTPSPTPPAIGQVESPEPPAPPPAPAGSLAHDWHVARYWDVLAVTEDLSWVMGAWTDGSITNHEAIELFEAVAFDADDLSYWLLFEMDGPTGSAACAEARQLIAEAALYLGEAARWFSDWLSWGEPDYVEFAAESGDLIFVSLDRALTPLERCQ